ncbi:MAG: hypothetical protein HY471_02110 [Candidatus Sungbacteria bacterium]|nr:hypothetical protein [Candidatus Sungbacteria bacterium]
MKLITRGTVGGFIFGLFFAGAHIFFNIRYDLPLYIFINLIDPLIECTGRGCIPFLTVATFLSALVWAAIGEVIRRIVSREIQEASHWPDESESLE